MISILRKFITKVRGDGPQPVKEKYHVKIDPRTGKIIEVLYDVQWS